ncbi:hypothetical protein RISK_003729 [Rhodopirellula islandica]|uniref:Uncharacterized protein n=1 Tax=Rhodopirellula islandica TaxID=595434 RepID=A0A0J1BC69_RHOIS|nr:hypothetical protein RISK_003729 [Rhodopirellula islandica]
MANGQIQFKTCGLMLAVGQPNRMQKRNFKTDASGYQLL